MPGDPMSPRLVIIVLLIASFLGGWLLAGTMRGIFHMIPNNPDIPDFYRRSSLELEPPETQLVADEGPGTCDP